MGGFDIIGDIHGHHAKLVELLRRLDYLPGQDDGVWRSTNGRTAIFVGDLIDRGPEQRAVLETVRGMVDHGDALIVMGNHEFNAIGWATEDPGRPGVSLRPHTAKNFDQHGAFLALSDAERASWVAWFATLPLWIEIESDSGGPLRVVHACWSSSAVEYLRPLLDAEHRFTDIEQIRLAHVPFRVDRSRGVALVANPFFEAVDTLLKGPEVDVHDYGAKEFRDKAGVTRRFARLRWWRAGETSFDQLAEIDAEGLDGNGEPCGEVVKVDLTPHDRRKIYADDIPVVFGHHWRTWSPTLRVDFTDVAACVDFSAAKDGPLAAYRFDGPGRIDPRHYLTADGPIALQSSADS